MIAAARAYWTKHGLTLAAWALTLGFWLGGYAIRDGPFDWSGFWMDCGHAAASIGLLGVLSYKLREVAKPED